VLEQLLAHAQPAVLGELELDGPVVEGLVELDDGLLLVEEALLGEGDGVVLEVGDQAEVKLLSAGSERFVVLAQIFAALV
jgi:hypothetical protein